MSITFSTEAHQALSDLPKTLPTVTVAFAACDDGTQWASIAFAYSDGTPVLMITADPSGLLLDDARTSEPIGGPIADGQEAVARIIRTLTAPMAGDASTAEAA